MALNRSFLSWVKKGLEWVGKNVGGVAGAACSLAAAGMGALGVERIQEESLTTAENNILTTWDDTIFKPFLLTQTAIYNSNIFNTSLDIFTRISFANTFIESVESFKYVHATSFKTGLSQAAIEFRNKFINDIVQVLLDKIYADFDYDVEIVTVSVIGSDILPIKLKETFNSEAITIQVRELTYAKSTTPPVATPTQIASNPVTPIVAVNNAGQTITSLNPVSTGVTESGQLVSDLIPSTINTTGLLKIAGFGIASFFLLKWAFKKK